MASTLQVCHANWATCFIFDYEHISWLGTTCDCWCHIWLGMGNDEEIQTPFAIISLEGNKETRYFFVGYFNALGHAFNDFSPVFERQF